MQAFPGSERYYPQQPPQYSSQQQQYYQQFPGYGYAQSGGQPIAAPFPIYPGMQPGTPGLGRPRPIDREISRTSTPGRPGGRPLKSALKRTRTPEHASSINEVPVQVSRGRPPEAMGRQRTRSGSRMRSGSLPRFVPDHLILTLRSTNELRLENIPDEAVVGELAQEIIPIWPRSLDRQEYENGKWKIRFTGSPWSSDGLEAIMAGKMIIRLYTVLAQLGFTYLSTVNAGNPWKAPQLIFGDSKPDQEAYVFLIMISKSGDRLTILDGPLELTQQLGTGLRATFPRKITTDRATEDGLHIFEVKKASYGVAVDKSLLIAYVLRFFQAAGFRLSGGVPMGTRSIFSLAQRKEMWIFRNSPLETWRPSSRQGHKEYGRRPSSRQSRTSRGDHDGVMV